MTSSVAFLVMYELRGATRARVSSLYENIVDVYDADVFVLCQRQFADDDARVGLFDRKVVKAGLYDARGGDARDAVERWKTLKSLGDANYLSDGNLNVYANNSIYAGYLGEAAGAYDWFVMSRTDVEILFPFPPRELLDRLEPGVYGFAPAYCEAWGGSGGGNLVHRDFILPYLTSYADCLEKACVGDTGLSLTISAYNQERLLLKALETKGIALRRISTINYFYTADDEKDRTTWSTVKRHPSGALCKYEQQCSEALANLERWNAGARWCIDGGVVCIK